MERREFLKSLGLVALSVQVAALPLAQADEPGVQTGDLKIKSGPSRFAPLPGHFHFLVIPQAHLATPPADGVKLTTSIAYLHHHHVVLSQTQLTAVSLGQTVVVQDLATDHHYEIKLA